mgnify:CR=1 FL=1
MSAYGEGVMANSFTGFALACSAIQALIAVYAMRMDHMPLFLWCSLMCGFGLYCAVAL